MNNMKNINFLLLLGLAGFILSCQKETPDPPPVDPPIEIDTTPYILEYGNLPPPNIAADNQLTIEGVKLGRMLFHEDMLSKDGTQNCASCHLQEFAFSDTARFSIGVRDLKGKRQAMSVVNMAWNSNEFFWDGRAHLLRDQSLLPIEDELEMDETLDNVIAKLSDSKMYRDQFSRAFGSPEVTSEKMSLAMEQFMNTIVSYNSKYDQFLAGNATLSESEERGRKLYFAEYNPFFPDLSGADCQHCHGGENFENDKYMNNGLDTDANFEDFGRENATLLPEDRAKFKVPSLRNIAVTPPYMHDGRFNTLEEVIDHYNEGIQESSTVDDAILATKQTGLLLTEQDKTDLVNFLKTLTDTDLLTNTAYASPF